MKNFRTFTLAVEFYRLCAGLPLNGDAKDQLKRSARSVALNLAEGRGRVTTREQKRFFYISMGSLRESQAVLMLEGLTDTAAWETGDRLGANLYRLIERAQ